MQIILRANIAPREPIVGPNYSIVNFKRVILITPIVNCFIVAAVFYFDLVDLKIGYEKCLLHCLDAVVLGLLRWLDRQFAMRAQFLPHGALL